MSSAIFNVSILEHKNPHKNANRVFQPALPNFRTVDGFALNQSVIQCAGLALRPNNIHNKNKDKNLKGGLMC